MPAAANKSNPAKGVGLCGIREKCSGRTQSTFAKSIDFLETVETSLLPTLSASDRVLKSGRRNGRKTGLPKAILRVFRSRSKAGRIVENPVFLQPE
jgi:hypothetical protein